MQISNNTSRRITRRDFTISVTAGSTALTQLLLSGASVAEDHAAASPPQRIFKSVKWGMVKQPGSVKGKFALLKSLGFDGVELESPDILNSKEVREASEATDMPVHGVVNMRHWKIRLSDPDPQQRERSRQILQQCIRESSQFGGSSVLLVPGRVSGPEETHDQVWQRSIEEIRKCLPLASRLGVRILVENVWNGFCESAEQFRDYLDEINSPWVGAYFDVGNARKFAPSEEWIRTLGTRILKLDIKGWGKSKGFAHEIGTGDVDWLAVREALEAINFSGWATAEVTGGEKDRLADIAKRMDDVLGLPAS